MLTKNQRVVLTLEIQDETAQEVAYEVLKRANPHDSGLVERKLEELEITLSNLTKYFVQLGYVVSEFWESNWNISKSTVMKPHELRSLYLPLLYSVIFASVGNIKIGNYEYVIQSNDSVLKSDGSVGTAIDKNFVIDFSARLESLRMYILGDTGQIGNRSALPQTSVMMAICTDVVGNSARIEVRDGAQVDPGLTGMAALLGIALVEQANEILYTGVDEVNFRELVGTIKQRELETPRA